MIDAAQDKLLRQIFSDAHVFDVDFSSWDKTISIGVFADHVESTEPGLLPAFIVEFVRVHKFTCEFRHFGIEKRFGYDQDDKHVQWRIDAIQLETHGDTVSVSLSEGSISPKLYMVCEDIEIRPLANSLLDTLFPGCNLPYSGLARPGIEEMGRLRLKNSKEENLPRSDAHE